MSLMDAERAIKVHVSLLSGSLCSVEMDSKSSVRDLKCRLEARAGVPVSEQKIIFRNSILSDGDCLQSVLVVHPLSNEQDASTLVDTESLSVTLCRTAVPQLYAFGGNSQPHGETYDAKSGAWSGLPSMKNDRHGLSATAIGNEVFVLGGEGGDQACVLATVEAFNVETRLWRDLPSMRCERYNASAVACNGRLYIAGGSNESGDVLDSAEMLDLTANAVGEWSELADLQNARTGLALVSVGAGVCAIGGLHSDARALATVEWLDVSKPAATWEPWPSMRVSRYLLAAATSRERIFAVGGRDENGWPLGVMEVFDVQANTWHLLSDMCIPRHSFAATASDTGICILGGRDSNSAALRSVAFYSLADGSWSDLPDMLAARSGVAAVAV